MMLFFFGGIGRLQRLQRREMMLRGLRKTKLPLDRLQMGRRGRTIKYIQKDGRVLAMHPFHAARLVFRSGTSGGRCAYGASCGMITSHHILLYSVVCCMCNCEWMVKDGKRCGKGRGKQKGQ
jgi:hypothetical protein